MLYFCCVFLLQNQKKTNFINKLLLLKMNSTKHRRKKVLNRYTIELILVNRVSHFHDETKESREGQKIAEKFIIYVPARVKSNCLDLKRSNAKTWKWLE